MKKISPMISKISIVTGLAFGAFALSAIAAWTNAPANPPNNNVDAPVNVGLNSQRKLGQLLINTGTPISYDIGLSVFGKALFNGDAEVDGNLFYKQGGHTPAAGLFLTSGNDGIVNWTAVTPRGGGGTTDESIKCISQTVDTTSSKQWVTINLLDSGGNNICESDIGCSIRMFGYRKAADGTHPAGSIAVYDNQPIQYVQNSSTVKDWTLNNSSSGVNGDSTQNAMLASYWDPSAKLYDDYPVAESGWTGNTETSRDSWALKYVDTSFNKFTKLRVVICTP